MTEFNIDRRSAIVVGIPIFAVGLWAVARGRDQKTQEELQAEKDNLIREKAKEVEDDMDKFGLRDQLGLINFSDLSPLDKKSLKFDVNKSSYFDLYGNEVDMVLKLEKVKPSPANPSSHLVLCRFDLSRIVTAINPELTSPLAELRFNPGVFIEYNPKNNGGYGFKVDHRSIPSDYIYTSGSVTQVKISGKQEHLQPILSI